MLHNVVLDICCIIAVD